MQWIDSEGRLFGKINLVDTVICIFLLTIFVTFLVYTYFTPSVNEHKPLLFQVYYKNVPLGILDLFQIGNELKVHNKNDRAIISVVKLVPTYSSFDLTEYDIIVTYNGTLEVGPDGQYLFNGFEITPGRELHGQINDFFIYGLVYRINLTNISIMKRITLEVNEKYFINITGDVYDIYNQKVGTILSIEPAGLHTFNFTGIFTFDVYQGMLYFQERTPIILNLRINIPTANGTISGLLISIEDVDQEGDDTDEYTQNSKE